MSRLLKWFGQRMSERRSPTPATDLDDAMPALSAEQEGLRNISDVQATSPPSAGQRRWRAATGKLSSLLKRPGSDLSPKVVASVVACNIEGKNYLFGLEWRLIPPTRALVRTLTLAKKEGQSLYVISEMEDIIGLGNLSTSVRGNLYSAAMHLAARFSQGGLELYAFELQNGKNAVIALNESRPIPGFDFLGDRQTAKDLIDEFLAIQIGQLIRQVGNAGLLEAEESVAPEDIFLSPAKSARVKSLPTGRSAKWLGSLALVLLLVFGGLKYWMEEERQRLLDENRQAAETPDVLYQRSLFTALNRLPAAGNDALDAWRMTVRDIPIHHKGWRLVRVECQQMECKAQWDRVYGNFTDFMNPLPANANRSEEVQIKNNPASSSVLTWHPSHLETPTKKIQRDELPNMRDGLRSLSDHLQDLSLLGLAQTKVDKPELYGGNGNPNELQKPVYSGHWSLEQPLWLIQYVQVPEHCILESLVIELFNSKGESEESFKINGSYYVLSEPNS